MAEFEKTPVMEKNPDKVKTDEEMLAIARKRLDRAISYESVNRSKAVEDLKFKDGDQWPASMRSARTLAQKPCQTVNKMKTAVHQVVNDQRQNRPSISVSPVGDKADINTAKMLRGLIRQIERQSDADVAYDTGFDNAVSNGFGYWRITTDYEDEDSFDQVIKTVRIRNPMRVYLDPDSQQPDGSDAQWGFITDMIPREEFVRSWPDADTLNFTDGGMGDEYKNWANDSHIRIAEYYNFEFSKRTLIQLVNGHTGWKDELSPDVQAQITSDPELIVNEREVSCSKIKWRKITAKQVLEENDWLGKWIPIVKCIGDEIDVEGKVSLSGVIRDAKDSQRAYNFLVTTEMELTALQPKAPFIMEEGQVEGHEKRWKEANVKDIPYLLYKGTNVGGKPAPPPQRQPFAGAPQAVIAAKVASSQDMMATTGIRFDASPQERLYDESGKALESLKRINDLGSFHYIDNFARSLKHTGRIYIDLIPKYYDTKRILTILREDGKEEQAVIDPSLSVPYKEVMGENGTLQKQYNPKLGKFDVAVTIGPNYSTKRAEMREGMMQFIKADPAAAPLIGDLLAGAMDWDGAEEIKTRLATRLPPNMLAGKLKDFPPEAKAMIQNLGGQLQKMQMEHMQALKALNDQTQDRQLGKYKVDKEFEAKLTKIAADLEKNITNNMQQHLSGLAQSVNRMESTLQAK